jgi:Asp-tRNA(Asn)/Glu-tRNA(Gln) amidotransferase A subunit family amidase
VTVFRRPDVHGLRRAFAAGDATPSEVAAAALAAIEASDRDAPPLRAVITTTRELATTQAAASTERLRAGRPRSPLDGVPILIKDNLDVAGVPTSNGTALRFEVPRTAVAVERMIEAGCVVVGKANLHEIGAGTTGVNPIHGTPRNAHDPERWCGGSSSGNAAAIAAGLVPLTVATDAGGSIRSPAAFCGAVGLKPTFGRVSRLGMSMLCDTLDTIGPIAGTCADAALALCAMAGSHPADDETWDAPPLPGYERLAVELGAALAGTTIGVARALLDHPRIDPRVATPIARAAEALAAAGARLVDVEVPDLERCTTIGLTLLAAEGPSGHERFLHGNRAALGADTQVLLAVGAHISARDYLKAQRARNHIRRAYRDLFEGVDLLLMPTTGTVAGVIQPDAAESGELDEGQSMPAVVYTFPHNLTGYPALSVPVGTAEGLPIGAQLVAPPWNELEALRAGVALERAELFAPPKPTRWYGAHLGG